uniref:Uncharacterized protein n=1 Tax=Caulobacter sp. (strain K31) TaxID=366602 RepID=B0T4P0_CAUSK
MDTFVKLPSGFWRAVVRRERRYIGEAFLLREEARRWATEAEREIDRGTPPRRLRRFPCGAPQSTTTCRQSVTQAD